MRCNRELIADAETVPLSIWRRLISVWPWRASQACCNTSAAKHAVAAFPAIDWMRSERRRLLVFIQNWSSVPAHVLATYLMAIPNERRVFGTLEPAGARDIQYHYAFQHFTTAVTEMYFTFVGPTEPQKDPGTLTAAEGRRKTSLHTNILT